MVKYRKFAFILAVLMLSIVFLAGCGADTGEEMGSDGGTEITDNSGSAGEGETEDQEEATSNHQDEGAEDKTTITARGTLKAAEAGKITIDTQSGDELVLEVNEKSKILADGTLVTYAQLTEKIGSEVTAEYYGTTKVVAAVSIQN